MEKSPMHRSPDANKEGGVGNQDQSKNFDSKEQERLENRESLLTAPYSELYNSIHNYGKFKHSVEDNDYLLTNLDLNENLSSEEKAKIKEDLQFRIVESGPRIADYYLDTVYPNGDADKYKDFQDSKRSLKSELPNSFHNEFFTGSLFYQKTESVRKLVDSILDNKYLSIEEKQKIITDQLSRHPDKEDDSKDQGYGRLKEYILDNEDITSLLTQENREEIFLNYVSLVKEDLNRYSWLKDKLNWFCEKIEKYIKLIETQDGLPLKIKEAVREVVSTNYTDTKYQYVEKLLQNSDIRKAFSEEELLEFDEKSKKFRSEKIQGAQEENVRKIERDRLLAIIQPIIESNFKSEVKDGNIDRYDLGNFKQSENSDDIAIVIKKYHAIGKRTTDYNALGVVHDNKLIAGSFDKTYHSQGEFSTVDIKENNYGQILSVKKEGDKVVISVKMGDGQTKTKTFSI